MSPDLLKLNSDETEHVVVAPKAPVGDLLLDMDSCICVYMWYVQNLPGSQLHQALAAH